MRTEISEAVNYYVAEELGHALLQMSYESSSLGYRFVLFFFWPESWNCGHSYKTFGYS